MSELIQWPRAKYWDRAWNPVIGCVPCSPACENCYARKWAERFGQSFEPHETGRWNPPTRGVVFAGNMSDLFGEWVLPGVAIQLIAKAADHDKATFLWLTKRTERMAAYLKSLPPTFAVNGLLDNQYFGFTAENIERFSNRFFEMGRRPAWIPHMWLSAEPLLGRIYLGDIIGEFDWVVVGCESGPKRRPCRLDWVEDLVEQCFGNGVPVFVKQLDIGGKCVTDIEKFPEHLRVRQVPWERGRTAAARQDSDGRAEG